MFAQQVQPQQTAVAVQPQIGEMLNSIMPLIMLMMVMMMLTPMMKGMGEAFK